jgi:hypothetical protein
MKKHLLNGLVAVGLLATLNSCSKDESVAKPETNSVLLAAPDTGQVVDLNKTIYTIVNDNYLLNTPLKLDKYRDGDKLDTACNKELSIAFNWPGIKRNNYNPKNPNVKWGYKPYVVDEYSSTIGFEYTGPVLILKLSKKVTEFGIEYLTPYYGWKYNVTQSIWDQKKNTKIADGRTITLNTKFPERQVWVGGPGGAVLMAVKSKVPFDEVRMTITDPAGQPFRQNLIHIIGGIRYKLAK